MGACLSNSTHGTHVTPEGEHSLDKMPLRPDSPQDASSNGRTSACRQPEEQQDRRNLHSRGGAAALPESVQTSETLPPPSRGRANDSGSGAAAAAELIRAGLEARLNGFEAMLTQLQQQMTNVLAENQLLRSNVAELTTQHRQITAQLHDNQQATAAAAAASNGGAGGSRNRSARDDDLDYGYGAKPDVTAGLALSAANAAASHASQLDGQMNDVQHRLSCLEVTVTQVKDMMEGQRAAQEFAKQLQRVQESGMLPSRNSTPHGSKQSASGVAAWMEPAHASTAALLPAPVAFPKLKPARERRRLDAGGSVASSASGDVGYSSGPAPRPRGGGHAAGRRVGGPPVGTVSSPRTGAGITPSGFKSGPSQYPSSSRPKPPGSGLRPLEVPGPSPLLVPSVVSASSIGTHPQDQYPTGQMPRTAPEMHSPVVQQPAVSRVESLIKEARSPSWMGAAGAERELVGSPSWADRDRSVGKTAAKVDKIDSPVWMGAAGERAERSGSKAVEKLDSPVWMGAAGERGERAGSKAGDKASAGDWQNPVGGTSFGFRGGGNGSGNGSVSQPPPLHPSGGTGAGSMRGAADWSETGSGVVPLPSDRPSAPPERSAPSHTHLEARPNSHQEWNRRGTELLEHGGGEQDDELRGLGERVAASVLSTATHLAGGEADWMSVAGTSPPDQPAMLADSSRLGSCEDKLRDSDPDIEMSGRFSEMQLEGFAKSEMMQMQRYDNVLPSDLLLAHHLRQGGGPRMGHLANGSGPKQFL